MTLGFLGFRAERSGDTLDPLHFGHAE
jgi:hypothetical protein